MLFSTLLVLPFASIAAAQSMSLAQALASQNSTLSTLNSLLASQPELVQALSTANGTTLLAPSNDAFSKFLAAPANKAAASDSNTLKAVLQYHVLDGKFPANAFTSSQQFIPTMLTGTSSTASMTANSTLTTVSGGQVVGGMTTDGKVQVLSGLKKISTVQTADIMFTGGVIHVVDTVLTVPPPPSTSALDNNLTSLATALKSTNLLTAVDSLKDITIFAPRNEAFAAISSISSTLTKEQLATILEYHIINGTIAYSSLLTTGPANMSFSTLSGGKLNVMGEDGKVFVNSAQVVTTDVIVSNGVIHVLDNVINPNNTTALPDLAATPQPIAFAAVAASTPSAKSSPTSASVAATAAPEPISSPAANSEPTAAAPEPTTAASGSSAAKGPPAATPASPTSASDNCNHHHRHHSNCQG